MEPRLLDRFVPEFQFREIHEIEITASPETIMDGIKTLRLSEIPLAELLMSLRSLPGRFSTQRQGRPTRRDAPFVDQLSGTGFLLLGENDDTEIVFGIVGKFWKPTGTLCREISTPGQFQAFHEEGWAKAGWNFYLEKTGPSTRLVTETRIYLLGKAARRKFAFYWFFVRGGSAFIRRIILKAVKNHAER